MNMINKFEFEDDLNRIPQIIRNRTITVWYRYEITLFNHSLLILNQELEDFLVEKYHNSV